MYHYDGLPSKTKQVKPNTIGHSESSWGPPPPSTCGPLIQAVRRERRRSGYKEGELFHHTWAWRAHRAPRPQSGWARPGLPDRALQPLNCWSWYPGNLEQLRHNPDFESREATRPVSLLLPHLTGLHGSEDIGAASPPVHRGGAWHTPLQARLQTEALHRLGSTPHFC